jgi:hypothetical protein
MQAIQEIQILISLQKDQTALIYTLWSVFQGLSLILIGYVFSQEHVRKSPLILACFTLSIMLFSLGNHSAIMRAQALVLAATDQLNAAAKTTPSLQGVLNAFEAPRSQDLAFAHLLFTVFVAGGVWVPFVISRISEHLGSVPMHTSPGRMSKWRIAAAPNTRYARWNISQKKRKR